MERQIMAKENGKGRRLAWKILAHTALVFLLVVIAVLLLVEPTGTTPYTLAIVAAKFASLAAVIVIGKFIEMLNK